jgi:hypothetical protein
VDRHYFAIRTNACLIKDRITWNDSWCLSTESHVSVSTESHVSVIVGADGQALVETRGAASGTNYCHVRFPAWAWRDASGNLVIDARRQEVEYTFLSSLCGGTPDWSGRGGIFAGWPWM